MSGIDADVYSGFASWAGSERCGYVALRYHDIHSFLSKRRCSVFKNNLNKCMMLVKVKEEEQAEILRTLEVQDLFRNFRPLYQGRKIYKIILPMSSP